MERESQSHIQAKYVFLSADHYVGWATDRQTAKELAGMEVPQKT